MKKTLLLLIGLVVATGLVAQDFKNKTEKVVTVPESMLLEMHTVKVVKVTKNRVIFENYGKKSRDYKPTNIKVQPGDLFWLKREYFNKRRIKWDYLGDYPSHIIV